MFEIEKSVPMPPKNSGWGKYPWDQMEVGDSFFVPDVKITNMTPRAASARKAKGRAGWRFTCRTEGNGVRVWRTA